MLFICIPFHFTLFVFHVVAIFGLIIDFDKLGFKLGFNIGLPLAKNNNIQKNVPPLPSTLTVKLLADNVCAFGAKKRILLTEIQETMILNP